MIQSADTLTVPAELERGVSFVASRFWHEPWKTGRCEKGIVRKKSGVLESPFEKPLVQLIVFSLEKPLSFSLLHIPIFYSPASIFQSKNHPQKRLLN
jgi:hypothetical protein